MTKNKELIKHIGINPYKPDSFQINNEPLMENLFLWSEEDIDLRDTIENFFGIKVRTKLVAILLDLDKENWVGVAASWQNNNQNGQIRIDSKLTEFLLDISFGNSPANYPFDIKKVNQLEINILQSFLENLETKMKENYEVDPNLLHLRDLIHLVWLVESDEGEIGRMAFSMPGGFKPRKLGEVETKTIIDIKKLANTGVKLPIDLKVGSTKLSFTEIKSFEKGDLILFEDSNIKKLHWHLGEINIVLPEEDHPIFIKDLKNIQELAREMVKAKINNEDPLSSLPLELSCEFKKVLIPLKKVLELKSGGVLPLGSVINSELMLTAQGKPVAKGELVIIGNQFGMRITNLLIGKKQEKGLAPEGELESLFEEKEETNPKGTSFASELEDLEEG